MLCRRLLIASDVMIPLPPTSLRASYQASRDELMEAVRWAVPQITRADGRRWAFDGANSTQLFFVVPALSSADPLTRVEVILHLMEGDGAYTLWQITTSQWLPSFFMELTALLDQRLTQPLFLSNVLPPP